MKRHTFLAIALLTALAAATDGTLVAAEAPAPSRTVHSVGGWATSPCVPTKYMLASKSIVCHGSSTWDGTWTGQTLYVVRGTLDLLSGDSTGTIDETFAGIDTATHAIGTMRFAEGFTIDGATGAIVVECHLVRATGAFAGYRGTVRFTGTALSAALAYGGYEGWLTRP